MTHDLDDDAEFIAAFSETINNDHGIDWRYWGEQMPVWSASQAARLMCALDPDIFADLNARPNRNDPSTCATQAMKIQRLAEAQRQLEATPAAWVAWADYHKLKIHVGVRLAIANSRQPCGIAVAYESPDELADVASSPPSAVAEQGLKRREQQIRAIEHAAERLFEDPRSIPDGGKKRLCEICMATDKILFGSVHQFEAAWKVEVGSERPRFQMERHSEYGRRE